MKAKEFDEQFDQAADISDTLDISQAKRTAQARRRIAVDFPQWMIGRLDREAGRLGVTREAVIKIWLSDRLEQSALRKSSHGAQ